MASDEVKWSMHSRKKEEGKKIYLSVCNICLNMNDVAVMSIICSPILGSCVVSLAKLNPQNHSILMSQCNIATHFCKKKNKKKKQASP